MDKTLSSYSGFFYINKRSLYLLILIQIKVVKRIPNNKKQVNLYLFYHKRYTVTLK